MSLGHTHLPSRAMLIELVEVLQTGDSQFVGWIDKLEGLLKTREQRFLEMVKLVNKT